MSGGILWGFGLANIQGEMLCFRPTIGGFVEMGAMYVSPSFGFMMGFTYALKVGLSVPSEMSAIAVLIGFWDTNTKVSARSPWALPNPLS